MINELTSREQKQMEKRETDFVNLKYKRQELLLKTSDGFFFESREGYKFGPYSSGQEVKMARQLFIYSLTGEEKYKPQVNEVESKALLNVEDVSLRLPRNNFR